MPGGRQGRLAHLATEEQCAKRAAACCAGTCRMTLVCTANLFSLPPSLMLPSSGDRFHPLCGFHIPSTWIALSLGARKGSHG